MPISVMNFGAHKVRDKTLNSRKCRKCFSWLSQEKLVGIYADNKMPRSPKLVAIVCWLLWKSNKAEAEKRHGTKPRPKPSQL